VLREARKAGDDPLACDVIEPNSAAAVNAVDGPGQEPAVRARDDSPLDPTDDAARGFPAGRVPEMEAAVLIGGEQTPTVRAGEDLQLLAGGRLPETEPPIAPTAAGKRLPVGRERERSLAAVPGRVAPGRVAPQFFPRADLP